jgi:hypothetical protein
MNGLVGGHEYMDDVMMRRGEERRGEEEDDKEGMTMR